jgi:large subunit ribosomal protein L7e
MLLEVKATVIFFVDVIADSTNFRFRLVAMKTPESVLKKQAAVAKAEALAAEAAKAAEAKAKADIETVKANAAKYQAEYLAAERHDIDMKRKCKVDGGFYVPAQPKLALVIRIRGTIGVSPKAKKVMQLFRLRQLHNATFVKLNEATIRMLRLIEAYVTYGYPSRATVEKLIYKRGFGKLNKQRIPIAENAVIEKGLGEFDIKCTADLVHEIVTVGPHFKQANNFLWPFKLSSPKGGFSQKTKLLHFMEGGEAGARGEEINSLVKRMN